MDRTISADAAVNAVAFSADAAILHGLCQDEKLRSWDVSTGAVRSSLSWDKGDTNPVLSPGSVTTVGKDGAIKTWDLATGKVSRRLPPTASRVGRTAVSSDGRLIAANVRASVMASETSVRVLDAAGKEKFVVPSGLGGLGALAISPDGASIVAASYDADVRAWSARNGELLRLIDELPVSMFALNFSPDGKYLAAAGADRTVYLYDAKTWKLARKFAGLPEMVSALAFSADGRVLVTGGFSEYTVKRPVKVIAWDVASGQPRRTVDAPRQVRSVACSPDGKWAVVATGERNVALWSV